MFQDLDGTLGRFFRLPSAPEELRPVDVSFQTPDTEFMAGSATLNLFLHHVGENRELRPSGPRFEYSANDRGYTELMQPLRVDCTYLVTTWSARSAAAKIAEEHELLGAALGWVSRNPVLPPRARFGSLVTADQYPVTMRIASLSPEETLSHFWSALGVPPRPAFTLVVTVEMPMPYESEPVPPVRTIHLRSAGTVPDQPSTTAQP